MKIVGSKVQKNGSIEHEFLLDFVSFPSHYLLYNLVKYCSILKIFDNFEQPMERAV